MHNLVAEAMEPALRPLVYAEPLRLVEQHRARGEAVYIVSGTLQEIVQAIADDLGFDGALGTVCEVRDGVYTGHALRALHAENKAACLRGLADERGYDLDGCTAYSDSHTVWGARIRFSRGAAVFVDQAAESISALDLV
jgi:phosphoserine phosphatase